MTLKELRDEVMAHGFSQVADQDSLDRYLNDGYFRVLRLVNYYVDEASQDFSTVQGTAQYSLPADFGRARSLRRTDVTRELDSVTLHDIDRSGVSSGPPAAYAFDGQTLHLWPTPDGAYPLELRYWTVPTRLTADDDVPSLPEDYHNLLWMYATSEAFALEDDPQTAQYWQQRFQQRLAQFTVDQRYPNSSAPTQARGMWDSDGLIAPGSWTINSMW